MTNEEKEMVAWKVEEEGIDYTFAYYDTFEEIEDEKFHELRQNYLKAAAELKEYIGIED